MAGGTTIDVVSAYLDDQPLRWAALLSWAVVSSLGGVVGPEVAARSRGLVRRVAPGPIGRPGG